MIALAVAEATMVRVAHAMGRGAPHEARGAGLIGIWFGVALLTVMMIAPLVFAEEILSIYIAPDAEGVGRVAAIAAVLMAIAAVFQVFDGLQAIAARALRGLRDTVAPLWIAAFGYWVLGVGGGALLAFPLGYGGPGLWAGLAAGLIVTALMLTWRFLALTGRPAMLRRAEA